MREGAIKYYKNNPDKLKNLASVLEAGCRMQGEYYSSRPPLVVAQNPILIHASIMAAVTTIVFVNVTTE